MKFDEEQMDTLTELVKKAQTEFVKSEDFTGALTNTINSAVSETVNKAITSKLKSHGNKLETRMAELIKEAVPVKKDDDEPGGDPDPGTDDAKILKSPAFRKMTKEHEGLKKDLIDERARNKEIEDKAFRKERDADLLTRATAHKATDPEVVRDALRSRVSRDDDGSLVIATKDKEGVETVQTTEEYVVEFLEARPHLVKSSGGGGAGSGEGTGGGAGGAGGEEVTREDLQDPTKYKRLRAEGKISGVKAAPPAGS